MPTYAAAALDEMARQLKSRSTHEPSGWNSMPGQPRTCYVCGELVRISRDSCGFRTMEPKLTWHFKCAVGAPPRVWHADV